MPLPLRSLRLLLALGLAMGSLRAQAAPEEEGNPKLQDLLALLNTPVVSASKTTEKLSEAPATVIVLRQDDLRARGYHQLSQILDDLPGMQVNRPYGDYYVKNYWRGFRNTQGDPYLLMVDGLVMNSLYYNAVEWALVTMPLANVDRIEVVYGPASAVYGSNAFMGVINVLTIRDRKQNGNAHAVRLAGGTRELRVADAQFLHKEGAFRFSLTARVEDSLLDPASSQAYEYSKDRYYTDRQIWGRLVDSPNLGGPHHSSTQARALDARLFWDSLELGLMVHTLRSGYGNEYAADRVTNNQIWGRRHLSLFVRQGADYAPRLRGTTTLRYLETGITPDSFFAQAYPVGGVMGIDFQYYKVSNASWSLHQDFEWKPNAWAAVNFGLNYERKDLQKAYELSPSYWRSTATFDPGAGDFPKPLFDTPAWWNRILTEDRGAYAQARFRVDEANSLILGARMDHGSAYGNAPTVRLGYVGNFGPWGLKALFGQAYNEPTASSLYATWSGSGADPNLDPEKSATTEFNVSFTQRTFSLLGSLWHVKNTHTIVSKRNLGEQTFTGLDFHGRFLIYPTWANKFTFWAYYSHLFQNRGRNGNGALTGLTADGEHVGDLARSQVKLGATLDLGRDLVITALGRHVGRIDAIASNPLGSVDAFTTVDANLEWKALFGAEGLSLALRASNLLDKRYFHPGFDAADAGIRPGAWTGSGSSATWTGSAGYYNSLLAQPGRSLQLNLGLTF